MITKHFLSPLVVFGLVLVSLSLASFSIAEVIYLGTDLETQGDWIGEYGRDSTIIDVQGEAHDCLHIGGFGYTDTIKINGLTMENAICGIRQYDFYSANIMVDSCSIFNCLNGIGAETAPSFTSMIVKNCLISDNDGYGSCLSCNR